MSNRRNPRRQHPAAHLDGTTLKGSCCNTEVSIARRDGMDVLGLAHDDWCPVLGDDPAARDEARIVCNLAVQAAIGGRTLSVVEVAP